MAGVGSGRFFRNEAAQDMTFPHPKSRKDKSRKKEKPNRGGVVGNFFKRTVDVTEDRNAEAEVNPAKDRAFGGVMHDFWLVDEAAKKDSPLHPDDGPRTPIPTFLEKKTFSLAHRRKPPATAPGSGSAWNFSSAASSLALHPSERARASSRPT